jgi:hypothetical protein
VQNKIKQRKYKLPKLDSLRTLADLKQALADARKFGSWELEDIRGRNLIWDRVYNEDPELIHFVKAHYDPGEGEESESYTSIFDDIPSRDEQSADDHATAEKEFIYDNCIPADESLGKLKLYQLRGRVNATLTNGYIVSCMHCKTVYYSRYRNGTLKCISCHQEQFQQLISDYGVTC